VRNFATALANAFPYLIFGYAKTSARRDLSTFSEPPKSDDDQPRRTLRGGAGQRSGQNG
jgi:hypothetical protein